MLRALLLGLLDAYSWVLIIWVLMSWIPHDRGILGQVYDVLGRLCEPLLAPIRKIVPPIGGMVDISPVILLFVLQLVVRLLVRIL